MRESSPKAQRIEKTVNTLDDFITISALVAALLQVHYEQKYRDSRQNL